MERYKAKKLAARETRAVEQEAELQRLDQEQKQKEKEQRELKHRQATERRSTSAKQAAVTRKQNARNKPAKPAGPRREYTVEELHEAVMRKRKKPAKKNPDEEGQVMNKQLQRSNLERIATRAMGDKLGWNDTEISEFVEGHFEGRHNTLHFDESVDELKRAMSGRDILNEY